MDIPLLPPPLPVDVPSNPSRYASTVSIPRLQALPPPPTLTPPPLQPIPTPVVHLVPHLFPLSALLSYYREHIASNYPDCSCSSVCPCASHSTTSLSIPDTPVTRQFLRHAQFGIPCSVVINQILTPLVEASQMEAPEEKLAQFRRDAGELQYAVAAVNLVALKQVLAQAWAFTLLVTSSALLGYGGVEVKLVVYVNDKVQQYHLYGIARPSVDLPQLQAMLETFSTHIWTKCLGVVAWLTEEEHTSPVGIMTSRVTTHVYRLIPRRKMFTPDRVIGERPPLMPADVIKVQDLKKFIDEVRPVLETTWEDDEIPMIEEDLALVKGVVEEWSKATGDVEELKGEGIDGFNRAWGFANGRFVRLRRFLGGLATAWLGGERSMVNVLSKDKREIEMVLQIAQLEKMTSFLQE